MVAEMPQQFGIVLATPSRPRAESCHIGKFLFPSTTRHTPTGHSIANSPSLVDAMEEETLTGTPSTKVFNDAPIFMKESLTFPYSYGMEFVVKLMQKGGKDRAFAGVLRNPPHTTRQIMEPETYLSGEKIEPMRVPDFKRDFKDYLESSDRVIRPVNYPPGVPGRGSGIFSANGTTVGVINVMGRTFMPPVDDPFRCADAHVEDLRARTPVVIVDLHAEATSEKIAMGRYLDGRVSCLAGTHTHVQTADEQILAGGTAYISDLGMTGPTEGIIGLEQRAVLDAGFEIAYDGMEFEL